ncbi:MAG: EAL domain-containing protein [Candidatus Nitrotoga sp.]|nr:EAL domain-containing protein [Candidatus Nitrotoga sp.]
MFKNLTIKSHLILIIFLMAVTLLGIWTSAMFGMSKARDSLKTVYEDRIIALDQLTKIESLILQNRLAIAASLATPTPDVISINTAQVEKNIAEIGRIWEGYMATYLTPEEKVLAAKLSNVRNKFITQGLKPVVTALRANEIEKSNRIVVETIRPLYRSLSEGIKSLGQLQLNVSKQEYENEQSRYLTFCSIFTVIASIGLGIATFIGFLLFRTVSKPLEKAVKIAQGVAADDLTQKIVVCSTNEIGQLMKALKEVHDNLVKAIGQVRGSEARTRAVLDNADEGIIAINKGGVIEIFNQAAEQIFGYTGTEIIGQNVSLLTLGPRHGQHDGSFEQHMELNKLTVPGVSREVVGVRKNGTHFPLAYKASEVCIDTKHLVIAVTTDLTARKESENALLCAKEDAEQISAELFSYVQAIDQHAIVSITDPAGRIIQANDMFCELSGFSREEMLGHDHRIVNSGRHPRAFFSKMWATIARGEVWRDEICNRAKNGELYWVDSAIVPVKGANGKIERYISVRVDITKRKESEQHIHSLAFYDVLTGLPNRTLLHDRLGQLIAESRRDQQKFAVLFIDLDRFKYVNDSMGHAVGDKLLQVVAQRLQEFVRGGDTVSRISGDGFIVLLRETDEKGAVNVADKILKTLTTPCDIGILQIATNASIGISIYPDNADSEDEVSSLIKHADVAMYRVKEGGRGNCLLFEQEMNFRAHQLFSMENDLRLALERNEFTLHYQPQANLISGMVCGAEALLRWKHPDKGFISPAEFIPVAEETGQIIPIGEWVLRTACAQLVEWRRQGMAKFPVSVNLSVRQLRQPDLAQMIVAVLEETGLHPNDLELEITEGVMMCEAQTSMAFLTQMHELGVQLAIDDFGTGYSSLSYLKKMPLDRLKVDQSFVRDIAADENDAAIVRSIISLGHQFKLQVIAEGVETLEQLDFLRTRGCDEIQGYYYSRPLPAKEFAMFVNSNPVLDLGLNCLHRFNIKSLNHSQILLS